MSSTAQPRYTQIHLYFIIRRFFVSYAGMKIFGAESKRIEVVCPKVSLTAIILQYAYV